MTPKSRKANTYTHLYTFMRPRGCAVMVEAPNLTSARELLARECDCASFRDLVATWSEWHPANCGAVKERCADTRFSFEALFSTAEEAAEFEDYVLSAVPRQMMPPHVRVVRDGEQSPTPGYWRWLSEQRVDQAQVC